MNEGAFLRFYHQKTNLYKDFKQNFKLIQGFSQVKAHIYS